MQLGRAAPLGASVLPEGVNFSVYSRGASRVELVLFECKDDPRPVRVIPLDPETNRTYHYWHVFVPGLRPGQLYGYRVDGSWDPANGMRFDRSKVLLDPYARCVAVPRSYSRGAARAGGDNAATAMKGVVVDVSAYAWEGDGPLRRPSSQTIVYEMHVRGFTRHPSSGVGERKRGTFAGVVEKIAYLKRLGITAVELMPVFQFDVQDAPPGRVNYWGYSPISFFAPHSSYASGEGALSPVDEFREMVKALHRAGIEVILDVVFNHTAEGDERGPTLSFRGFDNATYYILEPDRSRYANYSGTGNTLNANHPIVRRMIIDSLRYWVEAMHVDGFRFDLASILSRDPEGNVLANPPILWDIESEPALAGTKLIAEAWDAAGLYQVGSFVGDSWKEWNGRFRDDVRSFIRGDEGTIRSFVDHLEGSPSLYGHKQREPEASVNFVTSHDGFTLNDLVSYDRKHNEKNGEDNRDGTDDNRSWNCGVEGPTDDPAVEKLRIRQIKSFFTATLLAAGMPMILMGDEVRRTQRGNNNAYCLDDETSWFDWTLLSKEAGLLRFVSLLSARRTMRNVQNEGEALNQLLSRADITWHGVRLHEPDWSASSHSIAFTTRSLQEDAHIHVIVNAWREPLEFELPSAGGDGRSWRRWIDTSLDAPDDLAEWDRAPRISAERYRAEPHSLVMLFTGPQA
jgi:isoamylase